MLMLVAPRAGNPDTWAENDGHQPNERSGRRCCKALYGAEKLGFRVGRGFIPGINVFVLLALVFCTG
jgi:hypothetical protein